MILSVFFLWAGVSVGGEGMVKEAALLMSSYNYIQ